MSLIVGYKLAKAPIVLALALALTLAPRGALHTVEVAVRELSEHHALFARLAAWLGGHLSPRTEGRAALLAWLDGATTALEGLLLWRGHALGEWIVVLGLAALLPFEVLSLAQHRTWLKLGVLALNGSIVLYLVRRRLSARGANTH